MKTFDQFYTEVVSIAKIAQMRKKLGRRMAKMARSPAIKAKKKRAALRMRSTDKLAILARKKTKQKFRDKFYPTYSDMSLQQRVKIDQMIQQKYGTRIDKLSKKLAIRLKKDEIERVKTARASAQGKE